jgi:hypothetical protein
VILNVIQPSARRPLDESSNDRHVVSAPNSITRPPELLMTPMPPANPEVKPTKTADTPEARGTSPYDWLSLGLFAGAAVLIVTTFRDYGLSWDEPFQIKYGQLIIRYFASFFADRGAIDGPDALVFYGGFFDAPVELLAKYSPLGWFGTRRLATASVGLLGVVGCWRLGRLLGGPAAGFWAALFLVLTPTYYGHMFMNPKDIPFATGTVWTLYFMAKTVAGLPNPPPGLILKLGLVMGWTLGVRVGGILLVAYFGLMCSAHLGLVALRRPGAKGLARETANTAWAALATLLIAYAMMILMWPAALESPVTALLDALGATTSHPWDGTVLFKGKYVQSVALPADYIPVYFGVKLPEFILLALAAAFPLAAFRIRRAVREGDRIRVSGYAAVILCIFLPITYAIAFRTTHYDAIRHFLFTIPPMACLAGVAMAELARFLAGHRLAVRIPAAVALVGALLYHIHLMVALHPYEYVYYNRLTGGTPGAAGKFEMEYWATSFKEVAARLTDLAADSDRIGRLISHGPPYRVKVCGRKASLARFLSPPGIFELPENGQADFFVAITRWNCDRKQNGPIVARVERLGTTLAVIRLTGQ